MAFVFSPGSGEDHKKQWVAIRMIKCSYCINQLCQLQLSVVSFSVEHEYVSEISVYYSLWAIFRVIISSKGRRIILVLSHLKTLRSLGLLGGSVGWAADS